MKRYLAPALILSFALFSLACSEEDTTTPPPAGSPVPTPTSAAASTAPKPPSNLQVSGALPNLRTPVPAGQGEQGRITLTWQDNSSDELSFRIYQDCPDGTSVLVQEVAANTTSLGPLQSCRPGRVGVAAVGANGISDVVWSSS